MEATSSQRMAAALPDLLGQSTDAAERGDDVFFTTHAQLTSAGLGDQETVSIYDARVGGGFAEEEKTICLGEECRPQLTPSPDLPFPGSAVYKGQGNVKPKKKCPRGKRKVKRKGKVVCVKKKKHRKAGKQRKSV